MLAGAVRACDTNTAPRTQGRGSQTDCEGLHFSVMSWRTHPHLAEISGPILLGISYETRVFPDGASRGPHPRIAARVPGRPAMDPGRTLIAMLAMVLLRTYLNLSLLLLFILFIFICAFSWKAPASSEQVAPVHELSLIHI